MIGDIAALNEELERLRRKSHLLVSLMRLAQLPDVSEPDARYEALDIVTELTGSEAAFVFTVNREQGTLESGAWSSGVDDAVGTIAISEAGTWAEVVESGRVLIAGEGTSDESVTRGLGFPRPIERFVSTPIMVQGDVVAVAGVVNKPTRYGEDDRQEVSMLMHGMWTVLAHKQAQQLLREFSYEDPLTGLANRDRFDQLLRIEIRRSDRAGVPLGLLVIDLDDFTAYNATRGRPEGDRALKRVGDALRDSFQRAGEVSARLGEDSFCSILPATDAGDVQRAAERVREAIEALSLHHPSSDIADHLTASIGMAIHLPRSGEGAEALLGTAMAGLEESRKAGGNLVGSPLAEE